MTGHSHAKSDQGNIPGFNGGRPSRPLPLRDEFWSLGIGFSTVFEFRRGLVCFEGAVTSPSSSSRLWLLIVRVERLGGFAAFSGAIG